MQQNGIDRVVRVLAAAIILDAVGTHYDVDLMWLLPAFE